MGGHGWAVSFHGLELHQGKRLQVPADPLLSEEGIPRINPGQQGQDDYEGQAEYQAQQGKEQVKKSDQHIASLAGAAALKESRRPSSRETGGCQPSVVLVCAISTSNEPQSRSIL